MKVQENVSLAAYSTMGLGGSADYLVDAANRHELKEALAWATERQLPCLMIGSGSNIVWRDEGFRGLIIVNRFTGYEAVPQADDSVLLRLGAGEIWDQVVARSVEAGLTGIEALSLIPGTAGATPVQNVGAYGQEIAQSLRSLEAFDTQADDFVRLAAADCGFAYRTSRFKAHDRGRFYIIGLEIRLTKGNPQPPYYASVQNYFDERGITRPSPADLRQAVVAIRSAKLPDPHKVHNAGSFFANPIVSAAEVVRLRQRYPKLPIWPLAEGEAKIPAAWLIEEAGFKNAHDAATGMATWPAQPLVLVNEKAQTTADLLAFKQKIVAAVQTKFDITLEQEPELLP